TDESGNSFPGVAVMIKGTAKGTITDINGRYTIEVSEEDPVLVFSSVGYLTEEVSVQNRSVIDLVLYPDIVSLSEVVVTALGIERETKRLGYSATAVDPDELTTNRTTNVMESLEGKVAGLNISPPAAGVGSSM